MITESPFRFVAESQGACCPAEFLRQTRRETSADLAAFLGFSPRTIRYWRKRYKDGKVKCEKRSNCPRRLNAEPLELERQRRKIIPIQSLPQHPQSSSEHSEGQCPTRVSELPSDADDSSN
jgi:hypothetical protein